MSNLNDTSGEREGGSLQRMVGPLRLHLKGCYFDAIRDGTKTHEYRLAEKWEKRLAGKTYNELHLLRGYPKRGDESRLLRRAWRGYKIAWLTHPHFGSGNVRVLAIDVTARPNDTLCRPAGDAGGAQKGQSK
jgi:hypothetical protein